MEKFSGNNVEKQKKEVPDSWQAILAGQENLQELQKSLEAVPDEVLHDSAFQQQLLELLFQNVFYSEEENSEGTLWSICNRLATRGMTQLHPAAQGFVAEVCNEHIRDGNFEDITLLKRVCRPIIDWGEVPLDTGNLVANVVAGLKARSIRATDNFYLKIQDLTFIRTLDPVLQTEVAAEQIYDQCLKKKMFEGLKSSEDLLDIRQVKELYPEMMNVILQDHYLIKNALRLYSFISLDSFYIGLLSFEDVFGRSVAELGLSNQAVSIVEEKMARSLADAVKLKQILGLRAEDFREVLHPAVLRSALLEFVTKNSVFYDQFYVRLADFCSSFGVSASDLISDKTLTTTFIEQVWSSKEATESQQIIAYIERCLERYTIAIGADEKGKQELAVSMGFYMQERGRVSEGVHIHRLHNVFYRPTSPDEPPDLVQITIKKQLDALVTKKINSALARGRGRARYLLTDLEVIAKENNIPATLIAKRAATVIVGDSDGQGIFALNNIFSEINSREGVFSDVFEALRTVLKEEPNIAERLTALAIDQYSMMGSFEEIAELFRHDIFDETKKYLSKIRSLAVSEYLAGIQAGHKQEDVKEFFKLTEEDVELYRLRIAAGIGIKSRILSGKGKSGYVSTGSQIYSFDQVQEFANHFGISGKHFEKEVMSAMILGLDRYSLTQFQADLVEYNLPETIYQDKVFKDAAFNRITSDITAGNLSEVTSFIDTFGLNSRLNEIQQHIIDVWFKQQSPQIFQKIISSDLPRSIVTSELLQKVVERATILKADTEFDFETAVMANEMTSPAADKNLVRTADLFGEHASWSHYTLIHELFETEVQSDISPELQALGVTKRGEAGIEELRNGIRDFQKRIINDQVSAEELEQSKILAGIYGDKTRISVTQWGAMTNSVMIDTVRRSKAYLAEHGERGLSKQYKPSEVLRIATVRELKDFEYDQDFLERYQAIYQSISNAVENNNPFKKPLSRLVQDIDTERTVLLVGLEDKLHEPISDALREKAAHSAARSGRAFEDVLAELQTRRITQLEESIKELSTLELRSVSSIQENFKVLAKHKELHPILRETMFTFALLQREHRGRADDLREVILSDTVPSVEAISKVLDFVDHIVNQEVLSKYFTDPKAAQDFRRINSVIALEKQLSKLTQGASDKKMSMQFVPTRGPLLELSGQIADACWANKYGLISEKFPNITAVTMVGNPGEQNEKIVGSVLLIEAESRHGEPLLIIRGLNPLENTINKLDVEDFFTQFTTWAEEQADRMGRRLCVVIDGHSGGSASNRPKLYQFLSEKKNYLDQVILKSEEGTTFNSYNIVHDTWSLD